MRSVSRERVSVVVVLATLAVVANLCAQAVTDFVAARLVKAGAASVIARAGEAVHGPGDERPDVNAMLARNIFDATPALPAQEQGTASERGRRGGARALRRFEAGQATEESEPESGISQRELAENIEGNGQRFAMQRAFVERALQQQSEIVQGVRAVLHRENGRALGVKLYGIRGGGLFAKLGLQNGDVLRTINGFDLSTPDSALDAYAKLRSARHVSLALMRGGRDVTLDYTIRE